MLVGWLVDITDLNIHNEVGVHLPEDVGNNAIPIEVNFNIQPSFSNMCPTRSMYHIRSSNRVDEIFNASSRRNVAYA